ncbi:MAG: phosphotransferase [Nocardioidaceae bacterium]
MEWTDQLERLEFLRGKTMTVNPLSGGLTNTNLRVTTDDGLDIVVRCSDPGSEALDIDRDAEYENTRAAAAAGVGAAVVGRTVEPRMLAIEFLAGRALDDSDFGDAEVMRRAALAVRTLHAGPRFVNDFDMFARRSRYLATIAENGYRLPEGYLGYADQWESVRQALASSAPATVPCNNDLLAANFIDDGERVWLIDYEYSGNNDACFELGNTATECGFSQDQIDAWAEAYFGNPSQAQRARVRLQALVSCYGWSLWGFIQSAVSPIDYDFWSWGMERYEKAQATFGSAGFQGLLEDVAA